MCVLGHYSSHSVLPPFIKTNLYYKTTRYGPKVSLSVLNNLYFKTTCNIRPHFLGLPWVVLKQREYCTVPDAGQIQRSLHFKTSHSTKHKGLTLKVVVLKWEGIYIGNIVVSLMGTFKIEGSLKREVRVLNNRGSEPLKTVLTVRCLSYHRALLHSLPLSQWHQICKLMGLSLFIAYTKWHSGVSKKSVGDDHLGFFSKILQSQVLTLKKSDS